MSLLTRPNAASPALLDAVTNCSPDSNTRLLEARLGYTAAQRGAGSPRCHHVNGNLLSSFGYRLLGFPIGVHEGVLLRHGTAFSIDETTEFAGSIGANLLKLTRGTLGPAIAGELHTERSRLWTIVRRSARARELMPLGPSYEATLAGFGRHTRRNIRQIRKLTSNLRFMADTANGPPLISTDGRAALARRTRPNGVQTLLANRLEAHADQSGRAFRNVIRGPDGEIISYACGYFGDPATAYLLYQLNNPDFHAFSPSLLLRAHLIEWLVDQGCNELIFVHGCTGVLHHACIRQPLEEMLIMRRTPASYLAASSIAFTKANSSLGRLVRAAVLPSSASAHIL